MTFTPAERAVLRAADNAEAQEDAQRRRDQLLHIVPPIASPTAASCWASRALVIECLATGEPLARVARMLGMASVDALTEALRAHGLDRWTTAGGALVIAGRPT